MRTWDFKERFQHLPESIQRLAAKAFERFVENPAHPALRVHALADSDAGRHRNGSISVSINMQYRAIFVRDGNTNVW